MRILITNDDGIFSEGIKLLARALGELGEVTVVAPDREQSASGHSLTLNRPLRLRKIEERWFAVDGTPTDCVSLAVQWLMKDEPPGLIVSGINFGLNLGNDVTYSGTVSATFEGSLLGIPSVAFSQEVSERFSFERAAAFAGRLVGALLGKDGKEAPPLRPGLLLNVNLPAGEIRGVRWTRLGYRRYHQVVVEKVDPRGRKYYWIAGTPEWREEEGTDYLAIARGFASVTPLHLDLTDYRVLEGEQALRAHLEGIGA
jgi:5'-nucleotidase